MYWQLAYTAVAVYCVLTMRQIGPDKDEAKFVSMLVAAIAFLLSYFIFGI